MTKQISRRTMLRGAGAAIALPLLDSMVSAAPSNFKPSANSVAVKPRMICCYVPHGVNVFEWYPKETGANWSITPTLQPLADFKSDFTLISGLGHQNGTGGHEGADSWLTGDYVRDTPGKDFQNSISVDQVAAKLHGRETRFPSIELSYSGGTGQAGHSQTLSFDRNGIPLPAEFRPQQLFQRLFVPEDAASKAATRRRYAERRSILDLVLGEAQALNRRLGRNDQRKMDEYLNSVRETERRVERLDSWVDKPRPRVSSDTLNLNAAPHNGHDYSMWFDVMLELSYLAFQTDTTRVITFQFGREASGNSPTGVNHHNLSHHSGDPKNLAGLAAIDKAHITKLAHLLSLLKQTREEDGTMLERTMVLYGSGMSNGKGGGHSGKDLPTLLAGGSKLGLRHGQHLKFDIATVPLSNVLFTMLQKMGVEADSFSDSNGTLQGLV